MRFLWFFMGWPMGSHGLAIAARCGGSVAAMAAVLASAYHGPPELTAARAFTSWTVDLPVLIVVLLAGGLYLAGMRRAGRAGQPWPAGRAVAFCGGGLAAAAVATMSFVGVYQSTLFYA